MLVGMSVALSLRPLAVIGTIAVAAAVLAAGACSSSSPQEEQRPTAGGAEGSPQASPSSSSGASSSRLTELDSDSATQAQLAEGLVVAVEDFERAQDAQGESALAFDVTLTNTTGRAFDASRVAVLAFHGPDQQEAPPTIMELDEGGSGRSASFDAPIPDGQAATVTYGFNVAADHEDLLVIVEPEGIESVYFAGTVPA